MIHKAIHTSLQTGICSSVSCVALFLFMTSINR